VPPTGATVKALSQQRLPCSADLALRATLAPCWLHMPSACNIEHWGRKFRESWDAQGTRRSASSRLRVGIRVSVIKTRPRPLLGVLRTWTPVTTPPDAEVVKATHTGHRGDDLGVRRQRSRRRPARSAHPSAMRGCGKSARCVRGGGGWKRSRGWVYAGRSGEARDADKASSGTSAPGVGATGLRSILRSSAPSPDTSASSRGS